MQDAAPRRRGMLPFALYACMRLQARGRRASTRCRRDCAVADCRRRPSQEPPPPSPLFSDARSPHGSPVSRPGSRARAAASNAAIAVRCAQLQATAPDRPPTTAETEVCMRGGYIDTWRLHRGRRHVTAGDQSDSSMSSACAAPATAPAPSPSPSPGPKPPPVAPVALPQLALPHREEPSSAAGCA